MMTKVGLRGPLMVGVGRAAVGGALLLIGLLLARADRIGDFGAIARGISIAHILAQFTDGGALAVLVARSGEPVPDSLRMAYKRVIGRQVVGRSVLLAAVAGAAGFVFDVSPAAAAVVFVGVAWQRAAADMLRSDGRSIAYAVVSGLAPSGLWLVLALGAVIAGASPSAGLLLALHAVSSVTTAVVATVTMNQGEGPLAPGHEADASNVAAALRGRVHFFVEGLLEAAVRNVDVVLIALVVTASDAGRYALAARLVPVAMTPLAAVNGAMARQFSDRWSSGGAALLSEIARRTARLTTPLPVIMLAAAIAIWLAAATGDSATVAAIAVALLGAAAISTAAGSGGLLLGICRQEAASARISAISITISMVLLLIFGAMWGVVAGAYGFAFGIALQNVAQSVTLRRTSNVVSHV